MFDYSIEYPHLIEYGTIEKRGKYPNQVDTFKVKGTTQGFMDTPTSSETLQFHQMNLEVSIKLYSPYTFKFDSKKTYFRYLDKVYQCISDPDDQGGMNEVNSTLLKVTPYS
ncbi:phage head-tail adapter protein [Mammaliicoccus sciuri]|uniref:phage head-tail adapter protein n=1 Tax=Mammaliicoccus sciuri TaxID=1296 RepID=UPI001625E453|nr:phage head-tail adapter protein [Mammaliicoccus sciuri]